MTKEERKEYMRKYRSSNPDFVRQEREKMKTRRMNPEYVQKEMEWARKYRASERCKEANRRGSKKEWEKCKQNPEKMEKRRRLARESYYRRKQREMNDPELKKKTLAQGRVRDYRKRYKAYIESAMILNDLKKQLKTIKDGN